MRVLDTATVPRPEREGAFIEAVSTRDLSLDVRFDVSDGPFEARLDFWELGAGMRLVRTQDSGARWIRGARQIRTGSRERFAITVRSSGTGRFSQGRNSQALEAHPMYLNDHSDIAELVNVGNGETTALLFDDPTNRCDVDQVRRAATALPTSPLYSMFQEHLLHLSRIADDLPAAGSERSMLNTSTMELARALIATAGGRELAARDALRDSEVARVATYIRQHLSDGDLSAAKIARANHMSVRQVYKIWSTRDTTLAEHVMKARLRAAGRDLLRVDLQRSSIAEIASTWGFVSAAHFSKRFRAAYGVSPTEWRRNAHRSR